MVPGEEPVGSFAWLEQKGSISTMLAKIGSFQRIAAILVKNNETLKQDIGCGMLKQIQLRDVKDLICN